MDRRKKNRIPKIFTAVLLSAFLLAGTALPALTQDALAAETGSITVTMRDTDGNTVKGGTLSIYKAASGTRTGSGYTFSYTDQFRRGTGFSDLEKKADLSDSSKLMTEDAAKAVSDFQSSNGIKAVSSLANPGTGIFTFSGLEPGVYLVKQTERAAGYTAIDPFIVTVPDGSSNYNISASPKVKRGIGDPGVRKVIKGRNDTTTSFEFTLKAEEASNPMPSGSVNREKKVLIYGEGFKEFGVIEFTSPGTYHYIVTETNEGKSGYTYDTSRYRITYEVTGGSGSSWNVKRTVTPTDKNGNAAGASYEGETCTFTNVYKEPKTPSGSVLPRVTKKISGKRPGKESKFTFTMTPAKSTNPMPKGSGNTAKSVTISGTGTVDFGAVKFTEPGTYTYVIREKAGSADGYKYDDSVYRIVYKVTKSGDSLKITKNVHRGENNGKLISKNSENTVFTNVYSPGSTPGTPGGGTTPKKNSKLPQTGQLWWPVFILIAAGGTLIAVGIVRRKRS